MKEFKYKTGGRRLYNEDIVRLQQLSLAYNSIFADGGISFVISGCEVTRTLSAGYDSRLDISVSAGYVYMDGKVRQVAPTTFSNAPASYVPAILVNNITEASQIRYADGTTGPAYYDYGTTVQLGGIDDFEDAIVYNTTKMRFPSLEDFFDVYVVTKNNSDWQRVKTKGITKEGGVFDAGAILTMTDGEEQSPISTIIQQGLLRILSGDNFSEITPSGINTNGTISAGGNLSVGGNANVEGNVNANAIECNELIVNGTTTDSQGNVSDTRLRLSLNSFKNAIDGYGDLVQDVNSLKEATIDEHGVTTPLSTRFSEINGRINEIEETLNGDGTSEGAIQQINENISSINDENAELTSRIAELTLQNTTLRENYLSLIERVTNLQTNYANQIAQIQSLTSRIDAALDDDNVAAVDPNDTTIVRMSDDVNDLRTMNQQLIQRITALESANTTLSSRVSEVIESNADVRDSYLGITERVANLQTNYSSQLSMLQALTTRVDTAFNNSYASSQQQEIQESANQ